MGYGGNGKYYDSEMEYLLDPMTPKEKADKKEMDANEMSNDFQSRYGAIDIKPVVQAPEKLADALKSSVGVNPPAEVPKEENRSVFGKLTGTDGGERYQTWPERAVRGAVSAMALPGDVLSGKVEPGSVQEIEKAADLAMLMVGGPAPVAAKAADGSLGSFMGVKSKTINKDSLYKAQEMEMNGVHPDEIWNNTGTFRGADSRWRQEIDDSKATLKNGAFDHTITPAVGGSDGMGQGGWGSVGGQEALHTVSLKRNPPDFFGAKKPLMLDQVLDHPELFKAYPHLKEVKVEPLPDYLEQARAKGESNTLGQMTSWGTLHLANDLHPDFAKSVILHEVQHSIQNLEGFAQGGNALEFLPRELPKAKEEFQKVKEEALKGMTVPNAELWKKVVRAELDGQVPPKLLDKLEVLKLKHPEDYKRMVNIAKSEKLIEEAEMQAFTNYTRLMGEVEARNIQTRMNFNKFERGTKPPRSTEDVPRFTQIGNEGEYKMPSER